MTLYKVTGVGCNKAREVFNSTGGQTKYDGWTCRITSATSFKGTCRKSKKKHFKYKSNDDR